MLKNTRKQKEWTQQDAPLIWVEMIYVGDVVKIKKFFGFSFGRHCFISKNQTTSFYIDKEIREKAKKIGEKKYKNVQFIKELLKNTDIIEKKLKKATKKISSAKLEIKTNRELYGLLEQFFETYSSFAGIYRFTRPSFYEKLIESIKKKIPKPKEKNITLLLNNDFEKLNFVPNDNLKNLVIAFKQTGERRLEMHDTYLDTYIRAQKLFKEISKRLNLTLLEIQNCSLEELKGSLLNKKEIDRNEIQLRIKYFKFLYLHKSFKIETKSERRIKKEFKKQKIKGKVAQSGFVRGRVKVVKETLKRISKKEMNKVKKGDILVVTSTSPEMMPIIKKAKAIIADLGGTLSHAAIVSRELKIPCIIGTKIGTSILKDGDLIEVDANNGIVKKIK